MRYIWKIRLIRTALLTSFLTLIYFLVWNLIIKLNLLSLFSHVGYVSSSGEMACVKASISVEIVVWRFYFIPIFWSRIGYLLNFHYVSIILIFILSIFLTRGEKLE